ncbi:YbbR-like domain-containing protein [Phocaeicola salanitronis]|uniref:YbbR-like domain-containing protein n=1 Tax=Phocaeicola salanitronis TaxID=376805 RepID=UPI0025A473AF|nr:YbbR-like domain-containing protein [Phocaeicola salanitronis]MDM8305754.1 YbbR-like domain-containing protein [Phocaeicola salanitronis]
MFDVKNIEQYYRLGIQKIRKFLLSNKCKECLVFLFFVLVSFAFWMLQTLDDVYQTEFKVPLRLKNVPKEAVLTSELPNEVRVRVEDRGTVLLNYMLGRTFFPVSFDFNDYRDKGTHVHISSAELLKKVAAQLNVSTHLISVRPDTLDFIYTMGKAKKVPVRLNGEVRAGLQYYVSHIGFVPDSVIAYAPQEVLDTLTAAYTERVDLENVADTLHKRVSLQKLKGVKFVPAYNDLSVYVDMYSEKTVEVPIVGINFPANKVLRTFPSKVQVTFQVGLMHFKEISSEDFFIGVTYEDILKTNGDKLLLTLKSVPDYVSHARIIPASVDYLIEQTEGEGNGW